MELNRIYNDDCLDVMKDMDNNCVDIVVTDPPYLMDYRSNRRVKNKKFEKIKNDKNSYDLISSYIDECYRIMKDNTAIYMFCSWHHIDFFKMEIEKYFKIKNIIVWNKNNHGSGDLKGAYAPKYEFVIYAHKGRSLFREGRLPDVMNIDKIHSSKLLHPTEKPIDLIDIFIKNNSDIGDVVFDGFMGCGSTAISAVRNNRNYIGCELDSNYYNIAKNRVK